MEVTNVRWRTNAQLLVQHSWKLRILRLVQRENDFPHPSLPPYVPQPWRSQILLWRGHFAGETRFWLGRHLVVARGRDLSMRCWWRWWRRVLCRAVIYEDNRAPGLVLYYCHPDMSSSLQITRYTTLHFLRILFSAAAGSRFWKRKDTSTATHYWINFLLMFNCLQGMSRSLQTLYRALHSLEFS